MTRLFSAMALLLLSSLVHADVPIPVPDFNDYLFSVDNNQIVSRGLFAHHAPTIEDIERDRYQFNNYPQFLDYLFKQSPTLRRRFVLLHHTGSLQFASPEFPRVILFDGGMIYTASEHPDNRELRIEILQTSSADYATKLSEIVFPSKGGVTLNKQPQSCVACHGEHAKVLWDPYDFWPNVFGGTVGMMQTQQEATAYDKLKSGASRSPILSHLSLEAKIGLDHEENTAFTQYLSQINLPQFVRREIGGRDLGGWTAPLLAALNRCAQNGDASPSGVRAEFLKFFRPEEQPTLGAAFDRFDTDAAHARAAFNSYQDRLVAEFFPNPKFINNIDHSRLSSEIEDVSMIRVILDQVGVNAADMTTSHIGNDDFISTPANFPLDFAIALLEARPDTFKGYTLIPQDLGLGRTTFVSIDCDELKRASLTAPRTFAKTSLWRTFTEVAPERPVLDRCAKCHTEGVDPVAPYFPLADSVALKKFLNNPEGHWPEKILDHVTKGQMPPGHPLDAAEVESVRQFLSEFVP